MSTTPFVAQLRHHANAYLIPCKHCNKTKDEHTYASQYLVMTNPEATQPWLATKRLATPEHLRNKYVCDVNDLEHTASYEPFELPKLCHSCSTKIADRQRGGGYLIIHETVEGKACPQQTHCQYVQQNGVRCGAKVREHPLGLASCGTHARFVEQEEINRRAREEQEQIRAWQKAEQAAKVDAIKKKAQQIEDLLGIPVLIDQTREWDDNSATGLVKLNPDDLLPLIEAPEGDPIDDEQEEEDVAADPFG